MRPNTSWTKDVEFKQYPSLTTDLDTDVLIIGAGMAGILSAYLLGKEGKRVVIIEKDRIGEGVTPLTTAFLTQSIDTDFKDLISIYGENKARLIVDSHGKAVDLIEGICKDEETDAYFTRCSNFTYVNTQEQFNDLTEEYEAAKKLGIDCTLSARIARGFKNFGYIEMRNQAKFHPMKFATDILEKANETGVGVFEQTEAIEIIESPHDINTELAVKLRNGSIIKTKWIIATTYDPFKQPLSLFLKKGRYVSYILEVDIPKDVIAEGTYEDTENPYHYFRIDKMDGDKDGMLLGGADHREDIPLSPDKAFGALEDYLKETFGTVDYAITNRWSGPILEPSDGLAFIGPHKHPNILYAFGFSGNGMTYSGISAMIFRDLINNKPNQFYEVYRTDRSLDPKSLVYKARDYGSELIHGAVKQSIKQRKKEE